MRTIVVRTIMLSLLLLSFQAAHASSVKWTGEGTSNALASSRLFLNDTSAVSTEGSRSPVVRNLAAAQFKSSMAGTPLNVSDKSFAPSVYAGGRQLGFGRSGLGTRGALSVRCEVPPPADPPPSMVPEPSSIVLLGLGFATLWLAGTARGRMVGARG